MIIINESIDTESVPNRMQIERIEIQCCSDLKAKSNEIGMPEFYEYLPARDEVIGDPLQPFLFEVWRWLPHMPRHCIDTLRGIVKFRANSTTTAIVAVRQVKSFEVGRERSMLREEDNILSNPVSGTETN
ncbi:hypothetical protein AVEN_132643-1 [Araneus ventricosus]|uniref:Uncharacterized protein n=1 Tax=Araneus ventricosus TaxID=182803 RepID=A0A4Y2AY23_ARAVE|nr:hypothetical protein AVEN_132643-1 [Araneus ventricosus]